MSEEEILEYAEKCGAEAGYDLLLLCGPDGFLGTHEEYETLRNRLWEEAE